MYMTIIGIVELLQECFLQHMHMGTGRMQYYKETMEEGKQRSVNIPQSRIFWGL